MRFSKLIIPVIAFFSILSLAAFTVLPAHHNTHPGFTEKIVVFNVSFDPMTGKLSATEKLDLSGAFVQRNNFGRITEVNKDGIESQMPMATRITKSLVAGRSSGPQTFALISMFAPTDSKMLAPSDDQMLNYLTLAFKSFSMQSFNGSDYSISGKSWNCAGESCNAQIPAGIEVFVWETE
ncbi:MAG: hypothetical protein ACO25B_05435 [Chitinophagaceae bacterium]